MRKLPAAMIVLTFLMYSGVALAGDAAAGEAKADACLDCHMNDDFAGLSAAEIEARIRAAQAGKVKHSADIKDLAEADIADVAAWFAREGGG